MQEKGEANGEAEHRVDSPLYAAQRQELQYFEHSDVQTHDLVLYFGIKGKNLEKGEHYFDFVRYGPPVYDELLEIHADTEVYQQYAERVEIDIV